MFITNHLAKYAFLALIAVHGFLVMASAALAAEPSPPAALRAEVYSWTAAELFWTPPNRAFRPVVEKNEIRRNGMLIATVSGWNLRSYFDSNREPGKSYAYTVTAISSAGQASATVSDTGASQPQRTEPPSTTTPS